MEGNHPLSLSELCSELGGQDVAVLFGASMCVCEGGVRMCV